MDNEDDRYLNPFKIGNNQVMFTGLQALVAQIFRPSEPEFADSCMAAGIVGGQKEIRGHRLASGGGLAPSWGAMSAFALLELRRFFEIIPQRAAGGRPSACNWTNAPCRSARAQPVASCP